MSARTKPAPAPTVASAWLALFLTGCAADPGPISIRYATHAEKTAAEFTRVSEYFTDRETGGGDIVLRTDDSGRAGHYFTFALNWRGALPGGATAVVEYLADDSPEMKSHAFKLPPFKDAEMFREIRLGFTGKNRPKPKAVIMAWRITLRDDAGKTLATTQSRLWSLE